MAYVYEFLYRGRPDGSEAYHVIVADEVKDPAGIVKHIETAPMTPAQAEAAGFPLDKILSEITAAALRDREQAITAKLEAEAERDALLERNSHVGEE